MNLNLPHIFDSLFFFFFSFCFVIILTRGILTFISVESLTLDILKLAVGPLGRCDIVIPS